MIFEKLRDVKSPNRANFFDSGIDFFIPMDLTEIEVFIGPHKVKRLCVYEHGSDIPFFYVAPGESILIPLGVRVQLPIGVDSTFVERSSIGSSKQFLQGAKLIDNEYTGELILNIINVGNYLQTFSPGEKIVQAVMRSVNYSSPTEGVIKTGTARGNGGFGSTNS